MYRFSNSADRTIRRAGRFAVLVFVLALSFIAGPASAQNCAESGAPICDDGNACTGDACNPSTGECENWVSVVCDDGNACTTDFCDPASGACLFVEEFVCDDGNACTGDACNPSTGECENWVSVDCDDGDVCTTDFCDPLTGACFFVIDEVCNETPAGLGVVVEPPVVDLNSDPVPGAPDVTLVFEEVLASGLTTVTAFEYPAGVLPPPTGYAVTGPGGTPVIYEIESSATLEPGSSVEICFDYSTLPLAGDPGALVLAHAEGIVWVDITSANDTGTSMLCGLTDSFSWFVILEPFVVTGPADPEPVGATVVLGVHVPDPELADTVSWHWGDGTSTDVAVTADAVVASHTYSQPGVYTVTAQLLRTSGGEAVETGSAEFLYVVVYDPNAGFVTGSGLIDSPAGAFGADPSLTGKAQFGFISRYRKGAGSPSGNTEFQFHAGEVRFRSSSYDWLVISGARARFKGVGTMNGEGAFGFMLIAVDAGLTPSTDVDLFRIKIWNTQAGDAVIYDNGLGAADNEDPATAITAGSIVIHPGK